MPSSENPYEAASSNLETKQLVIAARSNKVEWTRDDTARALEQGWGIFTKQGNKVMRVFRFDGRPIIGIEVKLLRPVFRNDDVARGWVRRRAIAGSDLHRRAWALDGKTNRQLT